MQAQKKISKSKDIPASGLLEVCDQPSLRLQELRDKSIFIVVHEDFENPEKHAEILGPMPNQEKYDKQIEKMYKMRNTVEPTMRPCYERPLLNKEQEYHLFKKMHFYRYSAKKLIDETKRATQSRIVEIEELLNKAKLLANQIAECNFRLATQLLKKIYQYPHLQADDILGDGYIDVLNTVDKFDFTRGNKFSTYCTWVLFKNFIRVNQKNTIHNERNVTGMDDSLNLALDERESYENELANVKTKKIVNELLNSLQNSNTYNVERQIYILRQYFGLDGEKRTLDSLKDELGITKERVRQIREAGLRLLRANAEVMGLSLD
jgi:RNA polymerase sigma factor (sigma-70 family)